MASPKRFTAVNALLISTTRDKMGGRAKVKFQLTAKVTKALGWPEMPEGTAEWCPDVNELVSTLVELTPNNPELRQNSVSIDTESIGDFMVTRKKKKVGKNAVKAEKTITEVSCTIRFSDPTGCGKLEQYIQGAARSEMLVCYTPQPEQDELPGTRVDMSPEDEKQMPLEPGGPTDEMRTAVEEIPVEKTAPTHAEKLAARKAETERKKKLRAEAGATI